MLIASLVGLLVYSIVLRVSLESFIAIIRTAGNTRVLAENILNNPADSSQPEQLRYFYGERSPGILPIMGR